MRTCAKNRLGKLFFGFGADPTVDKQNWFFITQLINFHELVDGFLHGGRLVTIAHSNEDFRFTKQGSNKVFRRPS